MDGVATFQDTVTFKEDVTFEGTGATELNDVTINGLLQLDGLGGTIGGDTVTFSGFAAGDCTFANIAVHNTITIKQVAGGDNLRFVFAYCTDNDGTGWSWKQVGGSNNNP